MIVRLYYDETIGGTNQPIVNPYRSYATIEPTPGAARRRVSISRGEHLVFRSGVERMNDEIAPEPRKPAMRVQVYRI